MASTKFSDTSDARKSTERLWKSSSPDLFIGAPFFFGDDSEAAQQIEQMLLDQNNHSSEKLELGGHADLFGINNTILGAKIDFKVSVSEMKTKAEQSHKAEPLHLAEQEKTKGNDAVGVKDWKRALEHYNKSLSYNPNGAATLCNRALVHLKLKDFNAAMSDSNRVLKIEPNYTKALHRRGKAHFELGQYKEAVADFDRIMQLEPTNKDVRAELETARKYAQEMGEKNAKNSIEDSDKAANGKNDCENIADSKAEAVSKLSFSLGSAATGLRTRGDDQKVWDQLVTELDTLKTQGLADAKSKLRQKALVAFERSLLLLNNYLLSTDKRSERLPEINTRKAFYLRNIAECHFLEDDSDMAIKYLSQAYQLKDLTDDTKVKLLVQRGLAFEKLEKLRFAKNDFQRAKDLQPDSKPAHEGIERIDKILMTTDPELARRKALDQIDNIKDENSKNMLLNLLEKQKNEASNHFKTGEFRRTKDLLGFIVQKIEKALPELENDKWYRDKYNELYLQVLSNLALTHFNLNEIDKSLMDCAKALAVDPKHEKCLYRKALCRIAEAQAAESYGNNEEEATIERQTSLYDSALEDLSEVIRINHKNQEARDKRTEIIRLIEPLKLKLSNIITQKLPLPTFLKEIRDEDPFNPKLLRMQNKEKVLDATALKRTVKYYSPSMPQKVSEFESKCQPLMAEPRDLYSYIKVHALFQSLNLSVIFSKSVPLKQLKVLYQSTEVKRSLLINVAKAIEQTGIWDDCVYCFELLEFLTRTPNFSSTFEHIPLSDKKVFKTVIDTLGQNTKDEARAQKLLTSFKCNL